MGIIKFRAWEKITKEWILNEDLFINFKGQIFEYGGGYLGKRSPKSIELMQFTGVKDRLGKEVYEGDIVKFGCYTYEIKWGDSAWRLEPGGYLCQQNTEHMEVIGDIYNNPELITG